MFGGTPSLSGFAGQAFPGRQSMIIGGASLRSAAPEVFKVGMVDQLGAMWWFAPLSVPGELIRPVRRPDSGVSALDAADAVAELFEMSMEALAATADIGRTTIIYWRRTGATPRPSTVRGLWRLYGLAMSLRAVLGVAGTRSWLRSGTPSPLSLLEERDIGTFERLVARLAFEPGYARPFDAGVDTSTDLAVEAGTGEPARASRRSVRRGRLG
jgi:hypothetical protein